MARTSETLTKVRVRFACGLRVLTGERSSAARVRTELLKAQNDARAAELHADGLDKAVGLGIPERNIIGSFVVR